MNASRADDLDLVAELGTEHGLRALVEEVRAVYASGPPPEAGARLAAVLARGLGAEAGVDEHVAASGTPARRPGPRPPRAAPRRHRRVRLGLGALVGLSLLGTGAAGALPGPVQSAFERAAEAVTRARPDTPSPPPPADAPVEVDPTPGPVDTGTEHLGPRQVDTPFEPGPTDGPDATHRPGPNATAHERPAGAGLRLAPGQETGPDLGSGLPVGTPASGVPGHPGRPAPGRLPETGADGDSTGEGKVGAGPGGGGQPDSAAGAPRPPGPGPGAAQGPSSPGGPGPGSPAGARGPR